VKTKAAPKRAIFPLRISFNQNTDSVKSCTGATATIAVKAKASFSAHVAEFVL
jgi:hypothetical protein